MKLMNLMPLCGAFALCALTCSASDWLSPAAPGRAYPEDEADRQWAVLSSDLTRKARFDQFAAETVCAEALITATDRDPLDILLRRTAALLADLRRQTGVRDLTPESRELAALREQAETTNPEQVAARRAFFDRALRLRRRIAFANPLLDFREMLFIKRELRGVMEHCCDQFYGQQQRSGGGLFVLADPFGDRPALRDMLANARVTNGPLKGQPLAFGTRATQGKDGGSIVSPALDYDGKRIAFAYVEGVGSRKHIRHLDHARDGHWERGFCYHIFSAGTDGTRLTQLTDGTFNDFQPCFTPAGRIAFISERRGGYLRCGRHCPAFTLFDMAEDGSDIRCLSFHETNEWSPAFTHDGMLLWTRWDYVDRHGCVAHKPWLTTPDGRNPRPVHGNYSLRPLRPDMELDTRPIPESHLLLATAAPHHGQAFGSLVLIDPRAEDDDAMGPVRRLTPDAGFPESQKGSQTYGTPWPLSKHYALCAYTPVEALGTGQRHLFGLYLLDCFGNKELIYRDPGIACLNPIPLRASPRPPVLPEQRQRRSHRDDRRRLQEPDAVARRHGYHRVARLADLSPLRGFGGGDTQHRHPDHRGPRLDQPRAGRPRHDAGREGRQRTLHRTCGRRTLFPGARCRRLRDSVHALGHCVHAGGARILSGLPRAQRRCPRTCAEDRHPGHAARAFRARSRPRRLEPV